MASLFAYVMCVIPDFVYCFLWFLSFCDFLSEPLTKTVDDVTLTTNSTQTPSDMSPTPIGDQILHKAHHQNPDHCMASFAAINQMRQNAQVIKCRIKFY